MQILLSCKNHSQLRWSTEAEATSQGPIGSDAKYSGMVEIDYLGAITSEPTIYVETPECECKADCLVIASEPMEYSDEDAAQVA
jgi:hypothetical protein